MARAMVSTFSPETVEATNSTRPMGGVASPTVRLTDMMIAKWIGSMPSPVKIGPRIGPRMMIAGPASRNMPTTNSSRLMSRKQDQRVVRRARGWRR